MKALRADWICPVSAPPIRNGVVLVEDSRIADIGTSVPGGVPTERFDGCAILPGFVNAHIHLELTVFRGYLENLPFFEWVRRLTRAKYEHLSSEDLRASARLGARECLRAGVTAVGEVTDMGAGWAAMIEAGLRGVAYQEVFGPSEDVCQEAVEQLKSKVKHMRRAETETLRVGVSPHAPYTVSESLYERVRDLATSERLPIAVHLAESSAEGEFVRTGSGPFAEYWKSRKIPVTPRALSPVGFLDSLGLLGDRTLAIHAIDCDKNDVARLNRNGVAVAHCPKSNLKLGHRIAPVTEYLDAGIRVGLGTDSVASNNVVDMLEEMRMASFLQKTRLEDPERIPAATALRMATLGGAECLGLDQQIGSLDRGKLADLIVLDLGDPALQPVYDPVETLIYSASRGNVIATFLGGNRVDTTRTEGAVDATRIAEKLSLVSWD